MIDRLLGLFWTWQIFFRFPKSFSNSLGIQRIQYICRSSLPLLRENTMFWSVNSSGSIVGDSKRTNVCSRFITIKTSKPAIKIHQNMYKFHENTYISPFISASNPKCSSDTPNLKLLLVKCSCTTEISLEYSYKVHKSSTKVTQFLANSLSRVK